LLKATLFVALRIDESFHKRAKLVQQEIPMPLLLSTVTNPGNATWIDSATIVGGVTPITGLMFVDATYGGATPPDGSIAAPFPTIQGALNAIGNASTLAEQFQGWKIIVSGNFYDEDLTFPQRRSIKLDCAPGVILGDAFPPTTARKITIQQTLAPLGPVESYTIRINNLVMFDGIELVSGGAATAPTLELFLEGVTQVAGFGGTIAGIDGSAYTLGSSPIELRDCLIRDCGGTGFCFDNGAAGTSRVYWAYAQSTGFSDAVRSLAYGQTLSSTFENGDITFSDQSSIGNTDRPEGFFDCAFNTGGGARTWTMNGGSQNALVDSVSWNTLSDSNWTFVTTTIQSTSDEYVAGNTPAGNATWAAGGDNTVSNAIDRIAAALSGLLGGPIP
jgi:hypothetical protein